MIPGKRKKHHNAIGRSDIESSFLGTNDEFLGIININKIPGTPSGNSNSDS